MSLRLGVSYAHANTPAELLDGARRLCELLRACLTQPVSVVVADDYSDLLAQTLDGQIDVAWMPPLVYAGAIAAGATLLAINRRKGSVTYRACLLVRDSSPIRAVSDVRRLRAAWTDPNSACGYLLPRMYLRASGADVHDAFVSERFYGSATAACNAVASGEADLCSSFVTEATAHDPVQVLADVARVYPESASQLRVLAVTTSIPSDGIVVGPHIGEARRQPLSEALFRLHSLAGGAAVLKQLMNSDQLVPPGDNVLNRIAILRQQLGDSAIRR
jgi:phosphate/phosphite/phosphonate ABC transporter binding protein